MNFRAVLLTRCQREFEKDKSAEAIFVTKRKEIEEADDVCIDLKMSWGVYIDSHNYYYTPAKQMFLGVYQGPKNPLLHLSLLRKNWRGQVDYSSLSNCRMSAKQQDE